MNFSNPRVDLTVKIIELTPTADDFSCIFSILTLDILKNNSDHNLNRNITKIKGTIHKSINKFHELKVNDCLELKNAVVFDQFDLILFVNSFNIFKINDSPLHVPQKQLNYSVDGILNNNRNHENSQTPDEFKQVDIQRSQDLDQETLQINKSNETKGENSDSNKIIIAENNQQDLAQSSDSDDYSNLNFLESAEFTF